MCIFCSLFSLFLLPLIGWTCFLVFNRVNPFDVQFAFQLFYISFFLVVVAVNDKPVNKSIGSQATSTTFVMRQSVNDVLVYLMIVPMLFHFVHDKWVNFISICSCVCVYLYSSLCAFSHTNWSVNKYVTMSIVYTRFFFATKYAKTRKSKRFIQKPIAINRFFFHSIPEN